MKSLFAVAAVLIAAPAAAAPPPPEYYISAGGSAGWSDDPVSVSFNGPPYGAIASSFAGGAEALFHAVATVATGAVTTGPITAEMRYFFEVLGTPGEHVLVNVEMAGYASATTVLIDSGTSAAAFASSEGTVNGHSVIFCASVPLGGCSSTGAMSYDTSSFFVTAGQDYVVDLVAAVSGGVGCDRCQALGHAYIDPYIWIDPSQADQFSLLISAGVPNVPFTVPEPSTWAMMLLGFVGLGFAGFTRTRVSLRSYPRSFEMNCRKRSEVEPEKSSCGDPSASTSP